MTDKRHTIVVQPNNALTRDYAFKAHCAALPHLGYRYGATEQEALDRMAAVVDAASRSPEWPGPTFATPPPVGFVPHAMHMALLAERDALRAEVERLREAQTKAATDVLLERQRQISAEGWTHGHDDAHMRGELATAASAYAAAAGVDTPLRELIDRGKSFPDNWPWHASWWKPTSRRRDLVKAGSLILAEIERLDRAALREGGDNG